MTVVIILNLYRNATSHVSNSNCLMHSLQWLTLVMSGMEQQAQASSVNY